MTHGPETNNLYLGTDLALYLEPDNNMKAVLYKKMKIYYY